eukprot:12999477-Heterocapsa_arctica.AAC.1
MASAKKPVAPRRPSKWAFCCPGGLRCTEVALAVSKGVRKSSVYPDESPFVRYEGVGVLDPCWRPWTGASQHGPRGNAMVDSAKPRGREEPVA